MAVQRGILQFSRRNSLRYWTPSPCCALRARHNSSGSDLPEMPPCDFKPETYTGMSYERTLEVRKKHINPGVLTYYKKPLLVHQGHMQWLFDHTGRRYLDLFGGVTTVSVGHCHPKVVTRTRQQLDKLWHTTNIYMHPALHEFAEKLVSKLPENLKVVYFTNSGSEANDLAVFMSRLYTGAFDCVSLRSGYHGGSPHIMGLTALGSMRYQVPGAFGMQQTMNPDVYRGPWGGSHCRDSLSQTTRKCDCSPDHCNAADQYAQQLEDTLAHSCPKKIASFYAEPVQGVGGATQYPRGFLKKAYKIVRQRGGLCVADEVQTGFGRLGSHYWGFESHGVMPDIVTMAKGMGNGFPLAAVVTTPEIAETMSRAGHFNTYGGNPLSCTVGSAVMDVIEEDGIQENAAKVGGVFIRELMKLQEEFEVIGDVRGKGLMLGVELVKNRETRAPLPVEEVNKIWESCKDNGVLIGKGGLYGSVIRLKPPMCITEEDVHFGVAVMRKAFRDQQQN